MTKDPAANLVNHILTLFECINSYQVHLDVCLLLMLETAQVCVSEIWLQAKCYCSLYVVVVAAGLI